MNEPNKPNNPNDPFIWLPIIKEEQGKDVQIQSNITEKEFKMASEGDSREHAPIS